LENNLHSTEYEGKLPKKVLYFRGKKDEGHKNVTLGLGSGCMNLEEVNQVLTKQNDFFKI